MEGGTLILRVYAQVKNYFAYLSIIVLQSFFLDFIPVPDNNLSTAAVIAITAVICVLVAFIAGTLCGVFLIVCIRRWNTKEQRYKPAPNTQEQQQVDVEYEEMDAKSQKFELKENVTNGPVKCDQKIELEQNVAYGPVKRDQKIELEQNVAYGPVKRDQKIELKENVAYGPVKHDQKIELKDQQS